MPTIIPHVLAIGSPGRDPLLHAAGVAVRHATTLLDGYAHAVHGLADTESPPTLILLDLHAVEPGFPELAAPQLAAVLARALHTGALHPAWLIGLAHVADPDLDAEASLAGCHLVLHPPLSQAMQAGMVRLSRTPALLPPTDRATHAYQRAALRVVEVVQAAQVPIWTVADATVLLGAITHYPIRRQALERSPRAHQLVRALGGPQAAMRRLHAITEVVRERSPLHAEVLARFLDGWERRAIVHALVASSCAEHTQVDRAINELPQRLAAELRMQQAREEA